MQIVIDLPDDVYSVIVKQYRKDKELQTRDNLYKAIANGTPLPQGHGRLVDISEVLIKLMQFYDGDKTIGQCLDEVNTIIEADRSERSDKE